MKNKLWFLSIALSLLSASFFVDPHGHLGLLLRVPLPALQRYYMPVLAALLLLLVWLVGRVVQLANSRPASHRYDDLEAAWGEAMQFLGAAGIDIRALPVFLVIGPANESSLLAAEPHLTRIPLSQHAELNFYLHEHGQAVYVNYVADIGLSATDTAAASVVEDILAQDHAPLTSSLPDAYAHQRWPRRNGARLRHVCRLLVQERRPFCPVNGILMLVPLTSSSNDQVAERTSLEVRQQLLLARQALRVDCAVHFLVCGLEKTVGGSEFLSAMSAARNEPSLGLRLPLLPDIDPHEYGATLGAGISWMCTGMMSRHVFRLLQPGGAANASLVRFMADMQARGPRLARMVAQAVELTDGDAVMLGGLYFAGNAGDSHTFVSSVLRELQADQNFVSWTPATIGRDVSLQRVAGFGFIAIVSLLGLIASLGYIRWRS